MSAQLSMGPSQTPALWQHWTHSLLCKPTAAGQVEMLQPWPGAGCLGPALVIEEAAVTQRQALQAGTTPGHSHQALACKCGQQAQ